MHLQALVTQLLPWLGRPFRGCGACSCQQLDGCPGWADPVPCACRGRCSCAPAGADSQVDLITTACADPTPRAPAESAAAAPLQRPQQRSPRQEAGRGGCGVPLPPRPGSEGQGRRSRLTGPSEPPAQPQQPRPHADAWHLSEAGLCQLGVLWGVHSEHGPQRQRQRQLLQPQQRPAAAALAAVGGDGCSEAGGESPPAVWRQQHAGVGRSAWGSVAAQTCICCPATAACKCRALTALAHGCPVLPLLVGASSVSGGACTRLSMAAHCCSCCPGTAACRCGPLRTWWRSCSLLHLRGDDSGVQVCSCGSAPVWLLRCCKGAQCWPLLFSYCSMQVRAPGHMVAGSLTAKCCTCCSATLESGKRALLEAGWFALWLPKGAPTVWWQYSS